MGLGYAGIFAYEVNAKIVTARRDGFQAKIGGYDDPERRFIQTRSPNRPHMSALPTADAGDGKG
jgi:hypothetical protein